MSPARVTAEPHQPIKLAFRDALDGAVRPAHDISWTIVGDGGSISPDGTFTAAAPGIYHVYGSKGRGRDNRGRGKGKGRDKKRADTTIVVVVPRPTALAAVEITPGSATIDAGASVQFDAVGRDSDGASVAVGVEWTASGGTIDAGGLYIAGSSGGTYRIIAKHASTGLADTSDVAVRDTDAAPAPSPQPSPAPGSNDQPGDFITLSDRGFSAKVESGWLDRGDANFSIVSDAAAPRSSSLVGQARFPRGFPAGSAPILTSMKLGGEREVYLSFWVKLSENWYGNSSGVNKVFFIWSHGKPAVYLSAQGAGNQVLEPQIRIQDSPEGARNLRPNVASSGLQRGRWHRWEIILKANTPGVADGAARWWIDGTEVGHYSGIRFSGASEPSGWEYVVWNPTYGGSGDPVPHDQWMWVDHATVAGR